MTISEDRKGASAKRADDQDVLVRRLKAMKERGFSNVAIAQAFKISESSVRTLLRK